MKKECKNCFWNTASLETWPDFEGRPGEDKSSRIKIIKDKKCKECKEGIQDNFSEIWKCENCGVQIDGHQEFWHGSMCSNCWDAEVNQQNSK